MEGEHCPPSTHDSASRSNRMQIIFESHMVQVFQKVLRVTQLKVVVPDSRVAEGHQTKVKSAAVKFARAVAPA